MLLDVFEYLENTLKERIMFLDGAMGTMVQRLKLEESHFRGI
jgi:5-methyltetrahydrofolate--homocysteine methyltransferase